jgi:hypothetical protein
VELLGETPNELSHFKLCAHFLQTRAARIRSLAACIGK